MSDEPIEKNFLVISRLCPVGFNTRCVQIDQKLNMITVESDEQEIKCLFDECCEYTSNGKDDQGINFADQDTVYKCFERFLESREEGKFGRSCVLSIGPHGSGKSFTLFGGKSFEDRGLIPRFLGSVFDSDAQPVDVYIQMTIIENEEIFDLLDAPSSYSAQETLTETTSFGAMNMRCKFVHVSDLVTALEVLSLGVATAAAFSMQRNRPFSIAGGHLVTTIMVKSTEKSAFVIDFVELADFFCITGGNVSNSIRYKSTVALRDFKTNYPTGSSTLSFLLQDSIENTVSCCVISCILGTNDHMASKSNVCNLSVVNNLTGFCDSVQNTEGNTLVDDQICSRLHSEIEFTQKNIDHLLSILYDLDTIQNPTIKQQTMEPQMRREKRDELEKWLISMESSIHAARHMEMSAQQRATEVMMLLKDLVPSTQKDADKAAKELQYRMKLLFYRRKFYVLNSFASGFPQNLTPAVKKIYEEMPNFVENGISHVHFLRAWVVQLGLSGEVYWKISNAASIFPHEESDHFHKRNFVKADPDVQLIPFTSMAIATEYSHIKLVRGVTIFVRRSIQSLTYFGCKSPPPSVISSNEECLSTFMTYLQSNQCGALLFIIQKYRNLGYSDYRVVQIEGDSIEGLHAAFEYKIEDGVLFLYLTPFPQDASTFLEDDNQLLTLAEDRILALTTVNGVVVKEKIRLNDGDIVIFGISTMFAIRIELPYIDHMTPIVPLRRSFSDCLKSAAMRSLQIAIAETESDRVHNLHVKKVDRYMANIATKAEKESSPLMQLKDLKIPDAVVNGLIGQLSDEYQLFYCQVIIACRIACYLSISMSRDVKYSLKFKEIREEEIKKHKGGFYQSDGEHKHDEYAEYYVDGKFYYAEILCQLNEGDFSEQSPPGASWWWDIHTFIERFFMMTEMFRDFQGPSRLNLELLDAMYLPVQDPFLSTPDDELIGVSYLYPDALQYMLDINELLPIINFKGYICGGIQLNVRAWIDEIQLAPAYLNVDKGCKVEDFSNHKFIMRFYFESLNDIPARFSCFNRVSFKFFYHVGNYTTPYSSEKTRNPIIGKPIVIEQLITPDFIDFLQRGSIEFEVWGKRPHKLSTSTTLYQPKWSADEVLGDPIVFVALSTDLMDESSIASENAIIISELRSEVERLKLALDKKTHDLRSIKIELDQKVAKSTMSSRSPSHAKRDVVDDGPVVKNDDVSLKENKKKSSMSSACVIQ